MILSVSYESDNRCFLYCMLPNILGNILESLAGCCSTVSSCLSAGRIGVVSPALLQGTKHMLLRAFALYTQLTSLIHTRTFGNKHS